MKKAASWPNRSTNWRNYFRQHFSLGLHSSRVPISLQRARVDPQYPFKL